MRKCIKTDKAPAAIGPYSQGGQVGNLVYVSGQIPIDPATGEFAGSDITTQTNQSLTNVKAILEAAGLPDTDEKPTVAPSAPQEAPQAAQRLDFDEALLVEYFAATGRLQPGQTLVDLNPKLRAAIQERPADAMAAARAWKEKQEGGQA